MTLYNADDTERDREGCLNGQYPFLNCLLLHLHPITGFRVEVIVVCVQKNAGQAFCVYLTKYQYY